MGSRHLAILDLEGVPLAADVAKDGGGVKVELEGLGKGGRGVGKEADLLRVRESYVPTP